LYQSEYNKIRGEPMFRRWGAGCTIIGIVLLTAGMSMMFSMLISSPWIVIILAIIFIIMGGFLITC
jgi:hypothetical protein